MDCISVILAAAAGYILGDFIMGFFENLFKEDDEPGQWVNPVIKTYTFYNEGQPMDPNNKEVIKSNIRVMEESCEELRKQLRKLEEQEDSEKED